MQEQLIRAHTNKHYIIIIDNYRKIHQIQSHTYDIY